MYFSLCPGGFKIMLNWITAGLAAANGVIQQLCRPILTQFWPPTHLECTIVDVLHNTYFLFMWTIVDFLLTTYLPTSFCWRGYWMTPIPICSLVIEEYISVCRDKPGALSWLLVENNDLELNWTFKIFNQVLLNMDLPYSLAAA